MLKLEHLRHLHVELTTRCNARCPMCVRNYRGGEYNAGYPDTELDLDDIKKILTPEILRIIMRPYDAVTGQRPYQWQQGVWFNGNLGDFAAARDALSIVEYLRSHSVSVNVNTNGSLRTTKWWRTLGRMGITVGFALDGLADTHSLYRQDTDWQTVIDNACTFIDAGGNAVWRFIPFSHNRHQEQACRDLARDLGFGKFEISYDGRDYGPAFHRDGSFSHHIGDLLPTEDAEPPPWNELLQNHITWYDSKTFRHPHDTADLDLNCIHKLNREIYLAADGSVYPCCYLGFYPATMQHPGNKELRHLIKSNNNALEVGLAAAMSWFNAVEDTWQRPSVAQGRTYQCVATCNRNRS